MVLAKRHIDGRKYILHSRANSIEETQRKVKELQSKYEYVRTTQENNEWRIWVSGEKKGKPLDMVDLSSEEARRKAIADFRGSSMYKYLQDKSDAGVLSYLKSRNESHRGKVDIFS